MNWPSLTAESSKALAEVLEDAVHSKPKDLFEFVANSLQERSGKDSEEYEAFFQECKRRPRTYILEDQCPAGKDPLTWVPMRYNDDTILETLQMRAREMLADVLSLEAVEDTEMFLSRATSTFPEIMYLQGSPQELLAWQLLRAVYLSCSGCPPETRQQFLDDQNPALAFRCEGLLECVRSQFESALQEPREETLEAIVVCGLLLVLGGHAGFVARYGGGCGSPAEAALHAIEHQAEVLPSFARLMGKYKAMVVATLQGHFPLEMLTSTEAVPAHFMRVKELLGPLEGGLPFFAAAVALEHLVQCRSLIVSDKVVDLVRIGTQCLTSLSKYSAPRSYELMLKKRGERHAWRMGRDDFMMRAIVRVCCLAGREDDESWTEIRSIVEGMSDFDKEALKVHVGRRDGIGEEPVYVLRGAGSLLARASAVGKVAEVLRLLCQVLEDCARTFDRVLNHRTVSVQIESLERALRDGGASFEGTPFLLEEMGLTQVEVRVPGAAAQ